MDIPSSQEETSPFINVKLSSKEPESILEASICLEKENISLFSIVQVKDHDASKQLSEDMLLKAEVLEANHLPNMEGQKEENIHLFFVDPMEECVEIPTGSNYQAWILYKTQGHEKLSPSVIALILKVNLQYVLWIPLTSSQIFHFFLTLLSWLDWHFCII